MGRRLGPGFNGDKKSWMLGRTGRKMYFTFAGRSYFTEHGRRSAIIIYPNRLSNISAHRSARNTNEKSISIKSRSGNRSLVVAIACKYNFPRWRPKWRQNRYLYVSGHRSATKTNKEFISIILRSATRSPYW